MRTQRKRAIRIDLDSGRPADDCEATRAMKDEMSRAGFRSGVDLHDFALPRAAHQERHWAARAHIPFQLLFGR